MNTLNKIGAVVATAILVSPTTWAGDLTIPNAFTADTPAIAADVNSNFNAVEIAVDDNNTRITTNAGNISDNSNAIVGVQLQTKNLVTGCPGVQSIRAIAIDGTVTCEVDDDSNSGGDITAVTAGTGLTGGAVSGDATLSADTSYLQRRVTDQCNIGSYISAIGADGSVGCTSDADTTYSAGSGLDLSDTQFSVTSGGVGTSQLADDSVTGAKIAPGNVSVSGNSVVFDNTLGHRYSGVSYPLAPAWGYAPISLPDGVNLTGFYCLIYDATPSGYLSSIVLRRVELDSGYSDPIYATPTSGDDGFQIVQDTTASVSTLVDNSSYAYEISMRFDYSSGDLWFNGCRVSYQ